MIEPRNFEEGGCIITIYLWAHEPICLDYENARRIMLDCHLTDSTIEHVIDIIREISFKGAETVSPKSIDGKIVQDADRLDAMDNTEGDIYD